MKKLFILTLALLISTWAYAAVPDLTPQIVTLQNPNFKTTGLTGWTVEGLWSDKSESSAPDGNYIRIMSDANPPTMISQKVVGIGAGTYVLTAKGGVSRNNWGGNIDTLGKGKMYGCIYVTDNPEEAGDINASGCTKIGETGGDWTDFMTMFSTMENNPELEIGFGIPASSDGIPKLNIRVDMFELRYFPTMDQEAVKAYLDGTDYTMVQSVSLNVTSKTVDNKDPFTLTATIEPEDYSSTEKGVIWSSSNEDVATVDENGVVTPAGAGTCDIIASSKADALITAKCELTVVIPEVQVTKVSVSIEEEISEQKLEETKTLQLLATVEPGDATNKKVTWSSSDESIATVDENGRLTGVKAGKVTITATSDMVNTVKGSIELMVYKNAVTGITLSQETAEIEMKKTLQLTATVEPDNATYPEIKWSSSDASIASVDEATGLVTGISEGTVDIIATADGVSSTCKVTVKRIEVEDITLNATDEKMVVGAEFILTATVLPSNATDPSVKWTSSNDNVATVSNGVVTGTGIGTAIITAKAGEKTATCELQVVAPVEIASPQNIVIANPNFDEGFNGWTKNEEWTDNASGPHGHYALMLDAGTHPMLSQKVKGYGPGTYVLSAQGSFSRNSWRGNADNFGYACLYVTDNPENAANIDLPGCTKISETGNVWTDFYAVYTTSEENPELEIGFGVPSYSNSVPKLDLRVDVFVLTYYPTMDTQAVEALVYKKPYTIVKSIDIPATLKLDEGTEQTLTANINPADATNSALIWTSSDATVATVDQTGKVTAIGGGTAVITATSAADAMIKAECTVTVTVPVSSISLKGMEDEQIGEETVIEFALTEENTDYQLTATVDPEGATNKEVNWSTSNDKIATVEAGKVTFLNGGDVVITATSAADENISASCTFKVTVPATGLEVQDRDKKPLENHATLDLHTGDTYTLTAVVKPANTTDKIAWESSNTEVATIENGVITAKTAGNTTITAKLAIFSVAIDVVVTKATVAVTGVELDRTNADLKTGSTLELKATVKPDDASSKNVGWESSDPETASVDQNGFVTALKAGTVTITATAGGFSAICEITITDIEVTGITLDQTEIKNLVKGESVKLTATVDPENATDKSVKWTSDNEEVATVDQEGNVIGKAPGTATITAEAGKATATCFVTVIIPSESITLSESEVTLEVTDEFELKYTIDPEDATDTVIWSSNDETIATVDQNGIVKAIAVGEATITVKAGENTASCLIKVEELQPNGTSDVTVKMTYVNLDEPDMASGEIKAGELARSGYNKISGGSVGFGNTGWGVNYITYLQVDVSKIKRNIVSATLSFEASGATDSKRATTWGVGYNNSVWSADMTYNSANKSITLLGGTQSTSTTSAATFETFSFDITKAVKNADENGLITILVYETAAAGGDIKNPVVNIDWTTSNVYEVTFTESNGVAATVTMDGSTITDGIFKTDGIYNFKATAIGYQDFNGEFTVDGADKNVEFTMTPKATLKYTVKNNVNSDELTGSVLEGEDAKVAYSRYILDDNGTIWKKDPCGGDKKLEYFYTFTPATDNHEETLNYTATEITDGIAFLEAEKISGMTATSANNADIRCSNAEGAYSNEAVTVYTLKPGTYTIRIAGMGGSNKDGEDDKNVDFIVKAFEVNKEGQEAGEEKMILTARTNGSWTEHKSEPFTLEKESTITFEGANSSHQLDYILITGTYSQVGDADGDGEITLNDAIDIANYVLENKKVPTGWEGKEDEWKVFYTKAADVNKDGGISISDASATVSLVLEQQKELPEQAQARIATNYEFADNLVIGAMTTANGKTSVAVTLDNTTDFVAVQADIFMPEGVNFDVKPGSRIANSHSFQTKRFDDNHIRVVIYTFNGTAFADNNEALFEIVSDSYISDPSDITLAYMLASDANAKAYTLGARYDSTTGVAALGFDSNAPVKVYDLNGRYISDKVEGLEQGFYIIRQGDNAKKVHIR